MLDSGWYILGPENEQLELELAAFVGTAHCITVGNGTDALELALSALGVTRDDTVLTAANAGGYASNAARAIGARPVYADVDPTSLLLTPETLRLACDSLASQPTAVVVTHLYGTSADVTAILALCTSAEHPGDRRLRTVDRRSCTMAASRILRTGGDALASTRPRTWEPSAMVARS